VLRPELSALIISGHAGDQSVNPAVLPADVELFSKPFTAAALASKVRGILRAAKPPAGGTLPPGT
jgi:hypothetical protein